MLVLWSSGIGNTDAGFIMGTGKLLIKVPATMRFVLTVKCLLTCWRRISFCKLLGILLLGRYRAMEFAGKTVQKLTMEERMTLCNMAIEAGGKNGTIAADETTFEYVRARTDKPLASFTDADASLQRSPLRCFTIRAGCKPHSPDNRALARESRCQN